ncbi:MAG: alpha-ketoglutarate-dependent dioxygenase AlkB [Pseudomonadales bacterium]
MQLESLNDWPQALSARWVPDADHWFSAFSQSVQWRCESLQMYGRSVPVPRQVAWYGDSGLSYRYSGTDHRAVGWSADAAALRDWLEDQYQVPFNFLLLNHYRCGADHMGWHADDERSLLGDVYAISLGATRRLLLEPEPGERFGINLPHGSVIRIPRHWRHCLAKTAKPVAPRINLSFRQIETGL